MRLHLVEGALPSPGQVYQCYKIVSMSQALTSVCVHLTRVPSSKSSMKTSPMNHLSSVDVPSKENPHCLRAVPWTERDQHRGPSSRDTALTPASIGTDDPAVTFRLFRLLAAYCRLDRNRDVVLALLQCDQFRGELDRATALLEVRA